MKQYKVDNIVNFVHYGKTRFVYVPYLSWKLGAYIDATPFSLSLKHVF